MNHKKDLSLQLSSAVLEIITRDLDTSDKEAAIAELFSIQLNHVMANSEYNLTQTRFAILSLADGDLNEVIQFTKAAKIDFRDVIMWSMEKNKKK